MCKSYNEIKPRFEFNNDEPPREKIDNHAQKRPAPQ
jgi:hypothetical protein